MFSKEQNDQEAEVDPLKNCLNQSQFQIFKALNCQDVDNNSIKIYDLLSWNKIFTNYTFRTLSSDDASLNTLVAALKLKPNDENLILDT